MNKALVKQIIADPRIPKRPSASTASTGTTCGAGKAQTLLLHAIDKKAHPAEAKKLKAAEAKKAKADKASGK